MKVTAFIFRVPARGAAVDTVHMMSFVWKRKLRIKKIMVRDMIVGIVRNKDHRKEVKWCLTCRFCREGSTKHAILLPWKRILTVFCNTILTTVLKTFAK